MGLAPGYLARTRRRAPGHLAAWPGRVPLDWPISTLDLAGRKAINDIEGNETDFLEEYATAGSPKNLEMIEWIGKKLGLTSLAYQKLDDLVDAVGLPKEKLCTHCWDGSSCF